MNDDARAAAAGERYSRLRIPEKTGFVLTNRGWESPARYRLRRLAADFPVFRKSLRALGNFASRLSALAGYASSLDDEEAANRKYRELLEKDAASANEPGSGYGSADAVDEFMTTLHYARVVGAGPALDRTGTLDAARCLEETLATLIASDPGLSACLNFGASYAHADARLAARFPHVQFMALDRSPLTRVLNELMLPSLPNLSFAADDVFRVLAARDWSRGALVHCRTLVQLPMSLIGRLYAASHAAGFEYIVGIEPWGLSRVTGSSFELSDLRRPSAHFRDNLFLHNYPGLLATAGYAVERIDLMSTSHPHEDYRLLYFVARRCRPAP